MTAPAPAHRSREQEVKITTDSTGIKVDPDTFHISKGRHEEVWWTCNVDFTVEFTETPFHDSHHNKGYPYSGLVRREVPAGTGKSFKYTVTIAGHPPLDPDGQVDL
jgi:hypothetical protein